MNTYYICTEKTLYLLPDTEAPRRSIPSHQEKQATNSTRIHSGERHPILSDSIHNYLQHTPRVRRLQTMRGPSHTTSTNGNSSSSCPGTLKPCASCIMYKIIRPIEGAALVTSECMKSVYSLCTNKCIIFVSLEV